MLNFGNPGMPKQTAYIFILLYTLCWQAAAQYSWFTDFKSSGYSGAEGMSIGSDGIISLIGNFDNGVSIGGTGYSGRGSFFARITRDGVLLSHEIIRYNSSDFWHVAYVGTDGQGNSYICGTFPNTITMQGVTLNSAYAYNGFVIKIRADGILLWAKVIPNVQNIFDMKVNQSGQILLFSQHYSSVTVDHITLNTGNNSFGVLLAADGSVVWARTLGDPQRYTTFPKACAIDDAGNAYFHGVYNRTLLLDGKQVTSTGGHYDYFFLRLNPQGTCDWITASERKLPEYEFTDPQISMIVERGALQTDHQGNVYAAGPFQHGMKIGNITLDGDHLFLLKLNSTGTVEWARAPAGSTSYGTVDDVVIRNNRVYMAGIIPSNFHFSVYQDTGAPISEMITLPLLGDIASGLDVDVQDSLYLSGRRYTGANLNGFIFKYRPGAVPKPVPSAAGSLSSVFAYCIDESSIRFSASPVPYAVSYEWEIQYGDQVRQATSEVAELDVQISWLGNADKFSVRVRGVNNTGKGGFSPWRQVVRSEPLTKPVVTVSCNILEADIKGVEELKWYRDNVWIPEYSYPRIRPEEDGMYRVEIGNACGILSSDAVQFEAIPVDNIFIPNIITPNGDGLNDFFEIDEKLAPASLSVFNRFGKKVYSSDSYMKEWNGHNLAAGVYYYEIRTMCASGPIKGYLSIVP